MPGQAQPLQGQWSRFCGSGSTCRRGLQDPARTGPQVPQVPQASGVSNTASPGPAGHVHPSPAPAPAPGWAPPCPAPQPRWHPGGGLRALCSRGRPARRCTAPSTGPAPARPHNGHRVSVSQRAAQRPRQRRGGVSAALPEQLPHGHPHAGGGGVWRRRGTQPRSRHLTPQTQVPAQKCPVARSTLCPGAEGPERPWALDPGGPWGLV